MKLNKINLQKCITIIIGIIILISYIWLRFIRERLPKEIPYNLSFLAAITLTFICSLYLYYFISLIRTPKINYEKEKNIGEILYNFIMIPLYELDNFLKKNLNADKITLILLNNIKNEKNIKIIFIFSLVSRLIICLVLIIETFYFHYLSFLYKIILLGIIILMEKYIFFSLIKLKNTTIDNIKKKIIIKMNYETWLDLIKLYPEILPNYYDDEDEDYLVFDMMIIPMKEFFGFQEAQYKKTGEIAFYRSATSFEGYEEFYKENNIKNTKKESLATLALIDNFNQKNDKTIENLLKIIMINVEHDNLKNNIKVKIISNVIMTCFFFCWLYILFVSLPNLYLDSFFYSLLETSFKQNPFENNYYEDDE